MPDEPLVAFVPVSVRSEDSETGGDMVQVMLVPLPTDEEDAHRRLVRTHDALKSAKERHRAVPASAMQGSTAMVMPSLY